MNDLSELYWKVCDEELVFVEDNPIINDEIELCPRCKVELIRVSCPACLEDKSNLNTECDYCHDIEKWKRCTKCSINFK